MRPLSVLQARRHWESEIGAVSGLVEWPRENFAEGIAMENARRSRFQIEPGYLGLSATMATLLVYEPALHSFAKVGYFELILMPFMLCSLLAFTVMGLLLAAVGHREPQGSLWWERRAVRNGVVAAGALGFLVLLFAEVLTVTVGAVGLVAGTGSALTVSAWGRRYAGCSIQKALLHIAVSCVLGALLMNLIGTVPPMVACVLFLCLAVIGSDMASWGAGTQSHGTQSCADVQPDNPHAEPSRARTALRPLLAGLAEPLIGLFLFSLMFSTMGDHGVYLYYLSFLLGTLASGLCIVPLLMVNSKRPLLNLIYQVILPLLGLVLIVVALVAPPGLQGAVARSGFMLFFAGASMLFCASVVGYMTAGEFSQRLILGTSLAAYGLGGVAGTAIVLAGGRNELITSTFLALTCIYIVALAIRPSLLAWLGRDTTSSTEDEAAEAQVQRENYVGAVAAQFSLTEREREILAHVVEGHSSSHVARALFISESTVRGHMHHIYQKLGVASRDELVALLRTGRIGHN